MLSIDGDKMKKIAINGIKYVVTFVLLIVVFNVLLFLVCSFDSKSLRSNVISSSNFLNKQGTFYQLSDFFNVYNVNYTEALIINEAYSVDRKDPYTSYMKARRNYDENITVGEYLESTGEGITVGFNHETKEETYGENDSLNELEEFLNGNIVHSTVYGRYWHGYLLLYRPLLVFFNIETIKLSQLSIFIVLFTLLLYLIYKRFGKNVAIIIGISLIGSGYFSASYSLECAPIFMVMMISSIIYLKRIDRIKNFGLFIFIVGCITNYFDYLTVPLITLALPCSLYLIKQSEEKKDWKYCVKTLIICSIVWLIGYAGTWLMKWVLYNLTINDSNNMLKIGFEQVLYRSNRTGDYIEGTNFNSCLLNMMKLVSPYLIVALGMLLCVNKFKIDANKIDKSLIPFFLLSLYPIVWYIVLTNHTITHYYFTYRHLFVFSLGFLLCLNVILFGVCKRNN